jgi:hypothetical protein
LNLVLVALRIPHSCHRPLVSSRNGVKFDEPLGPTLEEHFLGKLCVMFSTKLSNQDARQSDSPEIITKHVIVNRKGALSASRANRRSAFLNGPLATDPPVDFVSGANLSTQF